MSSRVEKDNETIINLDTKHVGATFFTENGKAAEQIKNAFGVGFSQHRTKLSVISNDDTVDPVPKRAKAVEIVKKVLELQKFNQPITEKHINALINGEAEKPATKTVTKNNGNVVKQEIKKHPREKEIDLISGEAINILFETDKKYVGMIQSIFDTRINRKEKSSIVSVKPNGKPTRIPNEKKQEELLVRQAGNVLVNLAKFAADHAVLTDRTVADLALNEVKGAVNEEKTRSRVLKQLGVSAHPDLIRPPTEEEANNSAVVEKKQKHLYLGGDFGDSFTKDMSISGLFSRKLQMEISYYGKEGKRLTLTKKKGCAHEFALAEQVVLYAQEKYNDMQGSLNPALVDNAIDNVLASREVGFIDEDKRRDLVVSNRRERYKLSTYNRSGENINMYPRTESQYEVSDLLMGKPSKDQRSSFYSQGAKIAMLIGPAASGKTSWSIWTAVHAFKQGWIENLYLCRPDVMKQPALPGDLKMKTAMALAPLYENLEKVMPATESQKWIREPVPPGTPIPIVQGRDPTDRRKIEINDVKMMRGRTIENGVMIVDEAQNCTYTEIKTLMTRIGKGGSAIFSFDLEQIDLPVKRQSGALNAIIATYEAKKRGATKHLDMIACNGNLRHEVVDEVLDIFHAFDTNGEELTRDKRVYTLENQYEQALKIYWGTTDSAKIAEARIRERKYGYETTGYSPMIANKREANVIDFQSATMEIMISKTVAATVEALAKNGMLVQQPKVS